nr:MAG TPA: hypothetical protein [Caudoviricetes sp.]
MVGGRHITICHHTQLASFGTEQLKSKRASVCLTASIFLDTVYSIGSIYITFNDISPVDSVGGSCEKIDGKFLYATSTPNQTYDLLKHS